MNFWSDSIKLDSPHSSENFYFDLDTPRGHFFAILDFAPHDYANLDATLKLKLETIVGSFDSVPKFSTDLFLGFLAKEINNFLYELGKQSDGAQLFCSAAFCLLNGNRLAYFLCGDIKASILDSRRLPSLVPLRGAGLLAAGSDSSAEPEGRHEPSSEAVRDDWDEFGLRHWNAPLTDRFPAFTLHDYDVVLITTSGGEEMFEQPGFSTVLQNMCVSDPKSICDAVIENSSASLTEMTLLVIGGPYDPYVDPLSKSVESLEARVNALAESEDGMGVPDFMEKTFQAELEQRINPQIDELKAALNRKANSIDVLELNEILKNLGLALASKADTTDVLSLKRDILKLGIDGNQNHTHDLNGSGPLATGNPRTFLAESGNEDSGPLEAEDTIARQAVIPIPRQNSFGWKTALLVFILALGAAFIGAWLQSRTSKTNPEVWAVKTSGNQIWINRLDSSGQGSVVLNLPSPVKLRGEQTFSSFADVKSYLDTVTTSQASTDQRTVAAETQTVQPESQLIAKEGDSLKQSSHVDKIITKKSPEVSATTGKKPEIKIPNKLAANKSPTAVNATLKRDRRVLANSAAATTQARVGAGDTLDKLARRYKTTSAELRKLNPRINESGVIRPQQKIVVPASSANEAKGRRLMLVKQAH
jgi:LysM repeat protein